MSGDVTPYSLRFSWITEGLDPNLIEEATLCWSESDDDSRLCDNRVGLTLIEFLAGSYLIEGLNPDTPYFITLSVRYSSSQLSSNTVMAATTTTVTSKYSLFVLIHCVFLSNTTTRHIHVVTVGNYSMYIS